MDQVQTITLPEETLRTLGLLLSFFALAAFSFAQEDGKSPKVNFSKVVHDFGSIDKGEKVSVAFAFENVGTAPLEIKDVRTSCGCTTAKMEKTIYQPGEKGEIPVTFDSARFSKKITKTITVTTNAAENNGTVALKIQGAVVTELEVAPPMLNLVNIKRTEPTESTIMVSTSRLDKLEVSQTSDDLDFLDIKIEKDGDKTTKLIAKVDPSKAPNDRHAFRGQITVKTNGKAQPELKIPVSVRFEEPIRVLPRFISFYGTKKGQSREMTISLAPNGDRKFSIVEAKTDLDFVVVEPVAGEETRKQVKVQLSEKANPGKFAGFVTVKTNLKEQPEIKIPVRGSILGGE